MRLSRDYFFTLREDAKNEESQSGNLLVRAGMIKKSSTGAYMILPLGLRVIRKIEDIVREEMNAIDGLELTMPALIPEEVYIDSGRRDTFGDSMFSLTDRNHKPFVLGPTHEELFASAATMYIKSYKHLPMMIYQFQTKFRDEPRPRYGLIRVREFIMKDAYTFDRDYDSAYAAYRRMYDAYARSFDRMCLDYVTVKADTGVMGGFLSEEFQAISPIGEDTLVMGPDGYASNLEVAKCILTTEPSDEEEKPYEKIFTPESRTIEEVVNFLKLPAEKFVKTMIYNIDGKLYAIMCRGDHEINETKVCKLIGGTNMELGTPDDVWTATEAPIGFAGPVGIKVPVIMDQEVSVMKNFIVGANEADHHFINVNLRDFKPYKVADIRRIKEGDMCENGLGPVTFQPGIEVGNIFLLGTKYSEAMNLYFADENNELQPVWMGSHGIGPARCMAAIVEQHHDGSRIIWPKHLAPVQVAVVIVNMNDQEQVDAAEKIYADLQDIDLYTLIDDRDERVGVKFNDMELIGAYARITVGRDLKDGMVEIKLNDTQEVRKVAIDQVKTEILKIFS